MLAVHAPRHVRMCQCLCVVHETLLQLLRHICSEKLALRHHFAKRKRRSRKLGVIVGVFGLRQTTLHSISKSEKSFRDEIERKEAGLRREHRRRIIIRVRRQHQRHRGAAHPKLTRGDAESHHHATRCAIHASIHPSIHPLQSTTQSLTLELLSRPAELVLAPTARNNTSAHDLAMSALHKLNNVGCSRTS